MPDRIPHPGPTFGAYPEFGYSPKKPLQKVIQTVTAPLARRQHTGSASGIAFAQRVEDTGRHLTKLKAASLTELTAAVSNRLRVHGFVEDACASAFALVRELSGRALGMRHYDSQIIGGWAILNGMLAEMETGEGKTLTASLPACTAALAGIPVHVITVNDYLARRDMEILTPLYRLLGISVGMIAEDMPDPAARRSAYACDITYGTNKQIAFDYLRDRVAMGDRQGAAYRAVDRLKGQTLAGQPLLLRGLCFAIVDEADSVLIDEARTPLKLSGPANGQFDEQLYHQALEIADRLNASEDTFYLQPGNRKVLLTETGRSWLTDLAKDIDGIWRSTRRREALVCQALAAQHLFIRDRDYIIKDAAVQIVDENTGRVMADRSWEMGLHQLIEAKENLDISRQTTSLAQITYQRFFRRYMRLGAMSGTAREVAGELWQVYGLRVASIPSHKPNQRRALPTRIYSTEEAKFRQVVERLKELEQQGRPVLVGLRTVEASERLSAMLQEAGLAHEVLNAKQDSREAEIIARAGQQASITIATNMAGRGTDISLSPETQANGGLHVISAEQNDARRIDRQLFGRCGRQGDPGSFETMVSMEDDILQKCAPRPVKKLIDSILCQKDHIWRFGGVLMMRTAQIRMERRYARVRRELLRRDERLVDLLAFGGSPE